MTVPTTAAFLHSVLANPINRFLLERLPDFGLRDTWLVAGCLFQTVWNEKMGRAPTAGIRDYDIFYFDPSDLSWEAEDASIRCVGALLGDVAANVELKNQARVHLWYKDCFGADYPQLTCACDGVDRFLSGCTRVAVKPSERGGLELYAPEGLGDLYQGILRPNPLNYQPHLFQAKAQSYQERWPWLRIEGPQ